MSLDMNTSVKTGYSKVRKVLPKAKKYWFIGIWIFFIKLIKYKLFKIKLYY